MPITIEFIVKNGDKSFKEDSATFATPEELFGYISPSGGCEISETFLAVIHANY